MIAVPWIAKQNPSGMSKTGMTILLSERTKALMVTK
jgi:hypothetical protein